MVKKRLVIGFNGILLALFLDLCLLITLRSVDSQGRFQSLADKWDSLLFVSGLYAIVLLIELGLYLYVKHHRKKRRLAGV